ncbi:PST family polysaccharide transporter [Flavobacteriaceae bacterium MAR_2010_72]|nr:PST family polysaccharide transporter [Flavobacteriaceae bacterium MAR_2010_72]TVZ59001.1 PST family polysaccharide transporter [Flavobacteriaceae bacterium MAR_2010_105]
MKLFNMIKQSIKNNILFKVTSANTLLVFIRMFFALCTQKVMAIVIGAEGIAFVGNFRNVVSFFEQFSILGTFNGLVKYVSEFKENKEELNKLFSTVFVLTIITSLFSFIILFFGADQLNGYIFGDSNNFDFLFKILAFVVPFMGISAILNGYLNGHSDYKTFTRATIFIVVISAVVLITITITNGLNGSLLALSIIPLFQFLSLFVIFIKKYKGYFKRIDLALVYKNKLLSYSLMTLVVILSINWVDIAIRNLIENTISIKDAGYWTAMTSISNTYMQFTAAIFPLYILPKYSKMTSSIEYRDEVFNIAKFLIPIFTFGLILIFLLKNIVILLLYTDEFLAISVFFKWQLLGDLVKLMALIVTYIFLAKKQMVYFIFTELLSVFLFYGLSQYFIDDYGTEGVVLAHFVRYLIYFAVVLFLLRHYFFGKPRAL